MVYIQNNPDRSLFGIPTIKICVHQEPKPILVVVVKKRNEKILVSSIVRSSGNLR